MPNVVPGSLTQTAGGQDLYLPNNGAGVAGVSQIVAGSGITLSPAGGTGVVSISASGGGGGVASVASADGSITVSGTSAVNLTTAGTAQTPATLTATGAVKGSSLASVGNTVANSIASGTPISIQGFDPNTPGLPSRPVGGFFAYAPLAVPATASGAVYTSTVLNGVFNSNGGTYVAFSVCSPYSGTLVETNVQAYASAIYLIRGSTANSGGAILPVQVSYNNSGWVLSVAGDGTAGNPIVLNFTASGGATASGVLTITQLC